MSEPKFEICYGKSGVTIKISAPELDVEIGDDLQLQVQDHEIVFTAPPYYLRIPAYKYLKPGEYVPENMNSEKGHFTYNIPYSEAEERGKEEDERNEVQGYPYGFDGLYNGVLTIQNQQDLQTLSNPEKYSQEERHKKRLEDELKDFNPDHYGIDYVQYIINGLEIEPYDFTFQYLNDHMKYTLNILLEEKKRSKMRPIQNTDKAWYSLIDILLAIIYDKATNGNEINEVISHVNIHRISTTLSYFEEFSCYRDVLTAFFRRTVIYPFYRNKEISRKCVEILISGLECQDPKSWTLEKLVYAYDAFKKTDCVILNHYYIKDYIKFVSFTMSVASFFPSIKELKEAFEQIDLQNIGFDLEALEQKYVADILGTSCVKKDDSDDYQSCSEHETSSAFDSDEEDEADSDDYESTSSDSEEDGEKSMQNLSTIKEEPDSDDVADKIKQMRI